VPIKVTAKNSKYSIHIKHICIQEFLEEKTEKLIKLTKLKKIIKLNLEKN